MYWNVETQFQNISLNNLTNHHMINGYGSILHIMYEIVNFEEIKFIVTWGI